ncbi:MAG: hypothetical protein ED557_12815 [Balneola sp.]|nr:MAG: hypothetical protein ED557_12815 [Balneola sp.]
MSYIQTDQRIHYLSQILAKAGRTFIPKKEDDSHTNLYFNAEKNWIEGRWIETSNGNIKLVLRITDFCMLWVDEKEETIHTVSSVKKLEQEVISQLSKIPHQYGLDTASFSDPMHFEIPDYSFKGFEYQMINRHNLDEWMQWRSLGNKACERVLGMLKVDGDIRIWPHHFDTGIFVQTKERMGIGFGLAMQDIKVESPYFYMSGYPAIGSLVYENLPEIEKAEWITSGEYKGVVLPVTDFEETSTELDKYIEKALGWFLKH